MEHIKGKTETQQQQEWQQEEQTQQQQHYKIKILPFDSKNQSALASKEVDQKQEEQQEVEISFDDMLVPTQKQRGQQQQQQKQQQRQANLDYIINFIKAQNVDFPLIMKLKEIHDKNRTALHEAVAADDFDKVVYLCDLLRHDDRLLLIKDHAGRTALHCAKNIRMVKILVGSVHSERQRQLVLAVADFDSTVLHALASRGETDAVEYLCGLYGAELSPMRDTQDNTALHYPKNGDIAKAIIESVPLMQQQKFILAVNCMQFTVLHTASWMGLTGVVIYICSLPFSDDGIFLMRDYHGRTALHKAGNREIAKLLVESVQPEHRRNYILAVDDDMRTTLHLAFARGFKDVVEYLSKLEDACLLAMGDEENRVPLHFALTPEVASILIEAAPNKLDYIKSEDVEGNTTVMYLGKIGNFKAVSQILETVKDFSDTELQNILEKPNLCNQNLFHLTTISTMVADFANVWEEYILVIVPSRVIVPDIFKNTPLSYAASRYSTKLFAELVMRIPLPQRQRLLHLNNIRGINLRSILQQENISKSFYLESVLCNNAAAKWEYWHSFPYAITRSTQHEMIENPEKFYKYTEDIWKVMKYALNEYRIHTSDSLYAISYVDTVVQRGAFGVTDVANIQPTSRISEKQEPSRELTGTYEESSSFREGLWSSPSSLFRYLNCEDTSTSNVRAVQQALNGMDQKEFEGTPKIMLVSTSEDSGSTPALVPPGPDFFIIIAKFYRSSNARMFDIGSASCPDVDSLLCHLKDDRHVKYLQIYSTLGRRYRRDDINAALLTPEQQIIIGGECRGEALIICNRFNGLEEKNRRKDWELELSDAERVLRNQLGLKVRTEYDQTSEGIINMISDFSSSAQNEPIVCVAIMSHGNEDGYIWGNDGKGLCSVQDVVNALCIEKPSKIPKLLLLPFCRGKLGGYRANRTIHSWECDKLRVYYQSTSFDPVRNELSQAAKETEWARHPVSPVNPPENCYICYSTLPDTRSLRGHMFKVFSEHLKDVYECGTASVLGVPVELNNQRSIGIPPPDVRPKIPNHRIESRHQSINVPQVLHKDGQAPRVELTALLTDVSGLVREKSQFTQYMELCYTISRDTKSVVLEVSPLDKA